MSNQSHYEKLGVTAAASFEEIQTARVRLNQEYADDPKRLQEVEAAYDALLMERLRLRQEGKIDVPDGVRFAENNVAVAKSAPAVSFRLPGWITGFAIAPQLWDWLAPTIVYVALTGLAIGFPGARGEGLQTWMAIATGAAIFFVYRKENRILRAALWSFGGLALGFVIGLPLAKALSTTLPANILNGPLVSWVVFAVLWLVSVFFK
jgi:Protein CHAPERONE-LIKE PROTEIN OF POR1-like